MRQSNVSRRLLAAILFLALAVVTVSACGDGDDNNPTVPAAKELDSANLGSGQTYVDAITTPGTYPYHCKNHPAMTASLTVDASSPNATLAVSITDNAFTPASGSVQPGGTVTWTNNGAAAHTVTSD